MMKAQEMTLALAYQNYNHMSSTATETARTIVFTLMFGNFKDDTEFAKHYSQLDFCEQRRKRWLEVS
jgi:hypothetical protein